MIVHTEYEQGSVDWMLARSGIPTASEFKQLLTKKFEPRSWTSEMPNTYLAKKLAEAWQGGPLPGYTSQDMDAGNILEDQVKPWYTFTFDEVITNVGFITTDDGKIGCSPDGLIEPNCGIEIKCPQEHTHVRYLLAGDVPGDYLAQVHGGMYVTGRETWKFLSYRRHFPPLIVTVFRDDKIQEAIDETLKYFLERFALGWKRLEEINGGPPARLAKQVEPAPEPVEEPENPNDLIP